MDNRSYKSAAVAGAPTAPASPSVGYPVDGDPVGGITATKAGAYWFHQIGEELRAILAAASITPSNTVLNQILLALRAAGVFTTPALGDRTTKAATMACFSQEFGSSLGSSGYQKLPSGLIIQWVLDSTTASPLTVTWPIAFPTACLLSIASANNSSASYATIDGPGVNNVIVRKSGLFTSYVLGIGH